MPKNVTTGQIRELIELDSSANVGDALQKLLRLHQHLRKKKNAKPNPFDEQVALYWAVGLGKHYETNFQEFLQNQDIPSVPTKLIGNDESYPHLLLVPPCNADPMRTVIAMLAAADLSHCFLDRYLGNDSRADEFRNMESDFREWTWVRFREGKGDAIKERTRGERPLTLIQGLAAVIQHPQLLDGEQQVMCRGTFDERAPYYISRHEDEGLVVTDSDYPEADPSRSIPMRRL